MTPQHDHHHDRGHGHGRGHGHDEQGAAALAELLDLDGDVLRDYLAEVTSWLRQQAADLPHRRIIDLGAGTGTGTIALAQRFGAAKLIAVDASAQMLHWVQVKALNLGMAARVRTLQADLDEAWPAVEPVDIVWASNSLHELAEPDRAFKHIAEALRPGGLLAVAEMDSTPWFLPDDIGTGRPGLESRWRSVLANDAAQPPTPLGPDWGPNLARAGFTDVIERAFVIDLRPPHSTPVGRYAHAYLRRLRPLLGQSMAADDLRTIDTLLASDGPESLLHRGDLVVRNTRTVWLARSPA